MIAAQQSEVFFYLEDGPLKNKLVGRYLEEDDALADILEFEFDATLRIKPAEHSVAASIEGRIEMDDFDYQTSFSQADLDTDETNDLLEQLRPHCPLENSQQQQPDKNILRKKHGDDLLNIGEASTALGLRQQTLKKLIPCCELRIVETDGVKSIEGYYWKQSLIERFDRIWSQYQQGQRYTKDDAKFVADSCCEGDLKWAKDILATFFRKKK